MSATGHELRRRQKKALDKNGMPPKDVALELIEAKELAIANCKGALEPTLNRIAKYEEEIKELKQYYSLDEPTEPTKPTEPTEPTEPTDTPKQLSDMTVAELKELANERGIKFTTKTTKSELLDLLLL